MLLNVTCPFCSLLCDDLTVHERKGQLSVSGNACRLARQGFSAPPPASEAAIKGVPATTEQAINAAAKLLQKSRKPLIARLGTDVNGMRAALQLAEKTDAALAHSQEPYAMHNLRALQARGGVTTTLAEVKNRADTIIFIGNNVTGDFPRFIERTINSPYSLFAGRKRKLAYLGRPGRTELAGCDDHELVLISGQADDIAENLALLRARLADRQRPDFRKIPVTKDRKLKQVAEMVRDAKYGVLVWSATALPDDHADLVISAAHDLLRDLNAQQRFAGLSLGGSNGGASWQSVATWQTGFPAAVDFDGGRPSGAGVRTADVDSLLWISGFAEQAPPTLDVPTIILSPHNAGASSADVYIPTGVPGIDHTGNLFRTDGIISLPLKKLRDSGAYSAALFLEAITSRLAGRQKTSKTTGHQGLPRRAVSRGLSPHVVSGERHDAVVAAGPSTE